MLKSAKFRVKLPNGKSGTPRRAQDTPHACSLSAETPTHAATIPTSQCHLTSAVDCSLSNIHLY